MRIEAFGFRAVQFAQEQIEPLLQAFTFVLFFLERGDEFANHGVQRGNIIRQRGGGVEGHRRGSVGPSR